MHESRRQTALQHAVSLALQKNLGEGRLITTTAEEIVEMAEKFDEFLKGDQQA